MGLYRFLRELHRVGHVTVGTSHGKRGQIAYVAACTAEDCGWSVEYEESSGAMAAAHGHRCRVR
ncbi:mobile element transfer protein [Streptomyces sp. KL118A]|uniref:mobile element transfer protein n=1 Tax=Streptomyces sp. KL118A TaxID=3045153 RepID=UPI00278C3E50|nr:mobile element transfer protein [Streptomyces sp. KL118A]